jgi:sugar lactone lactonase YvrE
LGACGGSASGTPADLTFPTVSHLVIAAGVSQFDCGQTGSPIHDARALAVDRSGSLYIADDLMGSVRVEKIAPDGKVTIFAGTGLFEKFQASDEGRLAAQVQVAPERLAVDQAGNILISTVYGYIFRVGPDGRIHIVAGQGPTLRYSGDGGPARRADLYRPSGMLADPDGNLYISDTLNYRVRRVSTDGRIITIAGNGAHGSREGPGSEGDGGLATSAQLQNPMGLALDAAGNLYIADLDAVRKVTRDGMITTIAGNGSHGNTGSGGVAVNAGLDAVYGIAFDPRGNLYIAANDLLVVTPDGILHRIVPATVGPIHSPVHDVASDAQGNIYYAGECGVYRLGWN